MKQSVGNYLVQNIQKEAQNIKQDHLKILNDFNIPLHKYQSIQNEEERQKFLLDYMQTHIKSLSLTLEELMEAKKSNDQQKINEINKKFQSDKGLYAWLQVCTPHTSLHKKLRKSLIEKFQSEDLDPYKKENKMPLGFIGETSLSNKQVLIDSSKALRSGAALQLYIENTFEDFVDSCRQEIDHEKLTQTKRPSFWEYNKTTAQTIKLINAKNVDKSKPLHQSEEKKKKKRLRPLTAIQSQKTLESMQGRPSSAVSEQKEFMSPKMKQYLLKKQRQQRSKQLNWNDLYEKKFGEHKTDMRIRLADLSSTNSWNQVVLGSFIKLFTKKPKEQEKDLIKEYRNLTYNQVQKIVSSIPSLNECIDKKYFQSLIDKMNKQKIFNVETQISNKVITDYEKEKDKSKIARFKYLKHKADKKGREIMLRESESKKRLESQQRKRQNQEMSQRYRTILRGLDNNFTKLKTTEEHEELEKFHNPQKRGLPEPLDIPTETTEAYRNKTVYEYFKDCPNKPKFTHDDPASYYLQITTGGPIKAKRKQPERLQEIVARAALKIQRAIRRWRKKKQARVKKQEALQKKLDEEQEIERARFFVTESSKSMNHKNQDVESIPNSPQSQISK